VEQIVKETAKIIIEKEKEDEELVRKMRT